MCICIKTIEHRLDYSHLRGFDFVASAAGPAGQVRQDLTLLSVHAGLHVAPPLLSYDGSWSSTGETKVMTDSGSLNDLDGEDKSIHDSRQE